ncbi:MAG: helix-turn-helix transcriptional regulator [Proteobacteria bacterium]|nr:helix-turn-helix transcriptional regulator [Pseudomonadota bacterium]
MCPPDSRSPEELRSLPRPVYGHAETLPNLVLGYRHSHTWFQFSYASKGVLDVRTAAGRFIAAPQRAVWIPPGVEHQVRRLATTEVRSLYVAAAAVPWAAAVCRVVAVSPLLRELIRAFAELPVEYDEHAGAGRLVAVLLDQLAAAPDAGLVLPLPQDERLREMCARLEAQPDLREGLQDWSARLGVSERTLARLMRQQTGLSFRLWRQRLRLLSALPGLEAGQRVTDVALDCGYDSVSAFIAAFREQFGATPGEFFAGD